MQRFAPSMPFVGGTSFQDWARKRGARKLGARAESARRSVPGPRRSPAPRARRMAPARDGSRWSEPSRSDARRRRARGISDRHFGRSSVSRFPSLPVAVPREATVHVVNRSDGDAESAGIFSGVPALLFDQQTDVIRHQFVRREVPEHARDIRGRRELRLSRRVLPIRQYVRAFFDQRVNPLLIVLHAPAALIRGGVNRAVSRPAPRMTYSRTPRSTMRSSMARAHGTTTAEPGEV